MGADVTERRPEDPGSEGSPTQDVSQSPDAPLEGEVSAPEPEAESPGAPVVDFRDRWLRTEADFQNYRRRAQRDLEESRRNAEESVMLEVIAALDDLERAARRGRRGFGSRQLEFRACGWWRTGSRNTSRARASWWWIRRASRSIRRSTKRCSRSTPPRASRPARWCRSCSRATARGRRALRAARVVVAKREPAGGA